MDQHRSRDELLAEGARQGWRHHPNAELEDDERIGGIAFIDGTGHLEILYYNGDSGGYALWEERPAPEDVIREELPQRRHIYRDLKFEELGIWQQAAVTATRANSTVAALGLDLTPNDLDYAEYLRIALGRSESDPLRILARNDGMLKSPEQRTYTHPCPICGAPTRHMDRYPRSVCDYCTARTVDSTGRRISGANEGFSGGFIAYFAGTDEECDEVTNSRRCWIDDKLCSIDEARFGGIAVELIDPAR